MKMTRVFALALATGTPCAFASVPTIAVNLFQPGTVFNPACAARPSPT